MLQKLLQRVKKYSIRKPKRGINYKFAEVIRSEIDENHRQKVSHFQSCNMPRKSQKNELFCR